MARPRLYNDKQIVAALEQTMGLVYLAAQRIGCDAATIYNRAKKSKAIAKSIAHQRGKLIDSAELKLYQSVMNGQAWAIGLVLKTLGKERGYVERQEYTGKDGGPLEANVNVRGSITVEQRRIALAQLCAAALHRAGTEEGPPAANGK